MRAGTDGGGLRERQYRTRPKAPGVWLPAVGLVCVLAWIGHRLVFAQFQGYDDEGYLLITVQQFLQGSPLYDDVYTQYGPRLLPLAAAASRNLSEFQSRMMPRAS